MFVFIVLASNVASQERQAKELPHESYVRRYANLAIRQQEKYSIPASITLAQAIQESSGGRSALALESNNHFGIKCHDWKGAKAYSDDNQKNECFRKYKTVADSYEDHSIFLRGRSYYTKLFDLDIKDYKGWAKGLLAAGYATDKTYADRLIKVIEDYELYLYDSADDANEAGSEALLPLSAQDRVAGTKVAQSTAQRARTASQRVNATSQGVRTTRRAARTEPDEDQTVPETPSGDNKEAATQSSAKVLNDQVEPDLAAALMMRPTHKINGLKCVYAEDEEDIREIADELGISFEELALYNEMSERARLRQGDIIYLEKKKVRAPKPNYDHVVQAGESMCSISQIYGMRVESLYTINGKDESYVPSKGDVLRLR